MRAMVLVGGEGTRLRPLTWRTPKALVPVLGRPLLDHLLLNLRRHSIDHVTLALTHRSDAIREAFGDGSRLDLHLEYAYEDTPLGSGGAIGAVGQAWRSSGWTDETFVVVNGDVITDLDVSAMLQDHRERGAALSLALHEVEDPSPFGVVDIDADGWIHRFVEKPAIKDAPSRLINAGIWIFEPRLLNLLDPTTFNRVEDGLFPHLCAAGEPVRGFDGNAYWADVGNPAALLRVNLDMAAGRVNSAAAHAPADGVAVAKTATVDAAAEVESPAVIGAGSRLGPRASIARSLLWDDVIVEERAVVEDSILASGVHVGAGAQVTRSVVAHGARIEPGACITDQSIDPSGLEPPLHARTS